MTHKPTQLGKLAPQYNFFLNPYNDQRFSRCPQCEAKTGQKKVPLVIHVDPHHPVSLNYTCRYCAHCDLLIAHQDEIEHLLAGIFAQYAPKAIGNPYLVLGTFDRAYWKEGTQRAHFSQDLPDHLHDFKRVLEFELTGGWVRDEPVPEPKSRTPQPPRNAPPPQLNSEPAIDDVERAMALVSAMKAHLPIPVRPGEALVHVLRKQGISLGRGQVLHIRNVFYAGDEGGITCDVTPPGQEKQPVLCSLTHLEVVGDSPLVKEMRSYQQRRSAKLARQPSRPFSFTVKPRVKR